MADQQDYSIPMNTAKAWTKAWRSKMTDGDWLQANMKKAFLIPMEDFEELKKQGATNIRAYFGVEENTATEGSDELKLVLVGVDANGNDMTNEDQGESAYDYTSPCPPACGGNNSPLNTD